MPVCAAFTTGTQSLVPSVGMIDTGDAVTCPKNAGVTVSSCFKAEGSSSVGALEKSLICRKDDK